MKSLPLFLILASLGAPAGFAAGSLEVLHASDASPVSDTASGDRGSGSSQTPDPASLSADGRYAVFLSGAANLVPGQMDVNGLPGDFANGKDVFLADLTAGTTILVSHAVGLPATTADRGSSEALLSADGRWVAFKSAADDLAAGQPGDNFFNNEDLLLYDRVTGTTTLAVSARDLPAGFFNLGLSADGRYLSFDSYAAVAPGATEGDSNVFLYDRVAGTTRLVSHIPSPTGSPTNIPSFSPRISADGRFIAFLAQDLFPPPGQASILTVYLYDRTADTLLVIGPGDAADISADGNYVAFLSGGTLQLYGRETATTTLVSATVRGTDGGIQPRPFALNADGHFLVFAPQGPLPDTGSAGLALYERVLRTTTPLSRPAGATSLNGPIGTPAISADGRFITFASFAMGPVTGQTSVQECVFLFDRAAGETSLVSHAAISLTTTGNGMSYAPAISAGGARAVYFSQATDLEQGLGDLNGTQDLFAYATSSRDNRAVTRRAPDLPAVTPPLATSRASAISADGRYVAFERLTPDNVSYGQSDILLYDAIEKTTLLVDHVRASASTAAKGLSFAPVLSADGRTVAFFSTSRNLVPGSNPDGRSCLYLFDRVTGVVTFVARVTPQLGPTDERTLLRPSLSADGNWLAFASEAPDLVPGQQETEQLPLDPDVFLYDRAHGAITLVSHSTTGAAGASGSWGPILSADGRYLAFLSTASNLLPGEIGGAPGAYLYDRVTGALTLLSHPRSSSLTVAYAYDNLAMSADGRYIALTTSAGDLDAGAGDLGPGLYIYDRVAASYQRVAGVDLPPQKVALSADGRILAFFAGSTVIPGDYFGLFLYDRVTRAVSRAAGALIGSVAISGNGRYVTFSSPTSGLIPGLAHLLIFGSPDLYLFDRVTGATLLVNQWQGSALISQGAADAPYISADGQRIAFTSGADLVPGDFNRQPDAYLFTLGGSTPGGPVTVPPCALFSGVLRSNVRKPLIAAGACGVPAGAKQVQLKLTVSQGTGKGNVQLFAGTTTTPAAGILRFTRGATRSAAFNVTLGNGGFALLPFVAGNGTVRVGVEIDGYTP
jgi:Tol biopolymer transport system component